MSLFRINASVKWISAVFLSLVLALMSAPAASAAGEYAFSFSSAPDSVRPGDYFNVIMSINNPSGEKTNAAAIQATLQYDSSMISFVDATALNGSLISFDNSSKMITAYGEGHEFTDSIDFVTFTFQASDNASGNMSITASDPVLGTQDGKELAVTIGNSASVGISSDAEGSSVKPASEGGSNYVSASSSENSLAVSSGSSGSSSGKSGKSSDSGKSGNSSNSGNSGSAGDSGDSGDSGKNGNSGSGKNSSLSSDSSGDPSGGKENGSSGTSSDSSSADNGGGDSSRADGSAAKDGGKAGDNKTDADYIEADSGISGIALPLAVAAVIAITAAIAGTVVFLRRRKR